jgi:hypothetical protein
MHLPKAPASCEHLDLALVERVLAKHYGDIPRAAKELDVSGPDLNRLTWAKPKLLEEAELARMGVIARAMGEVIQAIYSDDPLRQMWGADKMLASWLARDHPLAPARRGTSASAGETRSVIFTWAGKEGADEASLDRDGRTIAVPKYGGDSVRPLVSPTPSPPPLPKPRWPGPHAPPPLVAGKYQPWEPPQPRAGVSLAAIPEARSGPELVADLPPRSRVRRPSRGGYR